MNGRVAFITGASRGVGAAVARSFHGLGASVALASRTEDDLGLGDRALALRCDVTSLESVQAAVAKTVERFGSLDVAVANAGVGSYGPFLAMDPQAMEQMLDVNLKGTLWTARATLPHLVASGAGDFVSLASVAGVRAFPNEAVYNASKFGQVGFTRALDHEMMEAGVRCTSVAPGGIATDFAMGTGRTPDMPELDGMMSAQDAADFVVFAVTRPRNVRMLTTTFRPMGEGSWG
jgi:NADP-dependent 3-hydroxy acid dehydrogenase YdfG